MPDFNGACVRPVVETLTECNFPIIEKEILGWGTALVPPPGLIQRFDRGAHAVLVDSLALAEALPDYGGTTSGLFSLLPHRDDSRRKRMRLLALSKLTPGERASATVLMMPGAAFGLLPDEETLFVNYRLALGGEREYDNRFPVSERQYHRCFDEPGGYRRTAAEYAEECGIDTRIARLNLLGYLIRGPHANLVMDELKKKHGHLFLFVRLSCGQVIFIDNDAVLHGRDGPGEKAKRNFCTGW